MMARHTRLIWLICLLLMVWTVSAQAELAATLEVLNEGVEVKRVNTENWIPVKIEAIVGVGDSVRTSAQGRARITFFADGTETEILPDSEFRILAFSGDDQAFVLRTQVLIGQTTQRLNRLLDSNSSYDIETPGMNLVARGTEFAVRVESSGRSAMLVREGTVSAQADAQTADVPLGFGVRADEASLSDVVAATTFEQLDSAIDGCRVNMTTPDDVSLNVRQGAALDFPRVGTVAASEISVLVGISESGQWYRLAYRGGYGWVLSSATKINTPCAGLRTFPNGYGPEDASLYEFVGDPPPQLLPAQESATPEATAVPASP